MVWSLTQSKTSCSVESSRLQEVLQATGGDGIASELFQILKDDAVKVLHSACQQIWKTWQWPQVWKSQFSSQFQRRVGLKNVQTTRQLHSLPMLVRLCSEFFKLSFSILEWRTSRYTSWVSKRQKNQRSNCQHSLDHREIKVISKDICFIDYVKAFDCVDHNKRWKILKEMGIPNHIT